MVAQVPRRAVSVLLPTPVCRCLASFLLPVLTVEPYVDTSVDAADVGVCATTTHTTP